MPDFVNFFNYFVRCLIRPPSANKTLKLAKRAGSTLKQYASSRDDWNLYQTIALTENRGWNELQRYSDEECWHFYKHYFSRRGGGIKSLRRARREDDAIREQGRVWKLQPLPPDLLL